VSIRSVGTRHDIAPKSHVQCDIYVRHNRIMYFVFDNSLSAWLHQCWCAYETFEQLASNTPTRAQDITRQPRTYCIAKKKPYHYRYRPTHARPTVNTVFIDIHCCSSVLMLRLTVWNSNLPSLVRTADSFTSFRSQLKT